MTFLLVLLYVVAFNSTFGGEEAQTIHLPSPIKHNLFCFLPQCYLVPWLTHQPGDYEVQTLGCNSNTTGNFSITFRGQTTTPINPFTTADEVRNMGWGAHPLYASFLTDYIV